MSSLPSLQDLSPNLNHAQLLVRLTNVLSFAKTNLERLEANAAFWENDQDPFVRLTDKVIIETALLAFLASRTAAFSEEIQTLVRALTQHLSRIARSERTAVLLLRFPHTAVSLGIAHIVLTRLGDQDEVFDALLRRVVRSGHVEAVERIPFRAMDMRWIYGLLDTDISPDFEDLIPHSLLATCAHPIYMNRDDAYALTHGLMYVTDFGALPPPAPLAVESLASMVDAGLAWHIMSEDMDLLGELLLSAVMLRQPWSPHAQFAWHMLTKVWDELEFLPSPSFEASVYTTLTQEAAASYAFQHLYHTHYVAGILCALLLRHPESNETPSPWRAPVPMTLDLMKECADAAQLARAFCTRQRAYLQHLQDVEFPPESRSAANEDTPEPDLHASVSNSRDRTSGNQPDSEATMTRILACLSLSGRAEAYWKKVLVDLPFPPWAQAVVLSDAALIQTARRYDLPLLARALLDATYLPTPPSLTFLEATAFLLHQQLPSGAIGAYFLREENLRMPESIAVTKSLGDCLAAIAHYLSRVPKP